MTNQNTQTPVAHEPRTRRLEPGTIFANYGMLGVLVVLLAVAVVLYPRFLSPGNVSDILVQNTAVGIVAVGMTFVIISGGFDLSVGAIYALGATVAAGVTVQSGSVPLGIASALAVGLLCGGLNGLLVSRLRINPFVATLGSSSIFAGIAYIYSNSSPFIVRDPAFKILAKASVAGIPLPIVILIATFILGAVALAYTHYGRHVYSVGGNPQASWLSGIRVKGITGSVYVLTGVIAAFAGTLDASRLSVGQADIGANVALDAIAIVIVGGTSLMGGEGAIWRTGVGLLIFATLTNLFYSLNVSQHWQLIAKGAIVLGAVALDAHFRKRRE